MKRLLLLIVLFVGIVTTASAVLKEKDLEMTLTFLHAELEQYHNDLTRRTAIRKERTKQLIALLAEDRERVRPDLRLPRGHQAVS